jgi:predicted dehydrogenase
VQYLRRLIGQGELGDIYHVDATKLRRDSAPSDPGSQCHRGGIGLGSTTHRLDMLLYLLGLPTPRAVSATTYDYFVRANNQKKGLGAVSGLIEDSLVATIHFENGCSALVRDMMDCHMDPGSAEYGWFGEFTLYGSKGGAKLHPLCIYHSTQGGSLHAEHPAVNNDLRAGHTPIYRYFFDCIDKGIKPEHSPERALMVMRLVDAIYASADSGGRQVTL